MILEMRQRCMERHTDEDDKLFDIGFLHFSHPPVRLFLEFSSSPMGDKVVFLFFFFLHFPLLLVTDDIIQPFAIVL